MTHSLRNRLFFQSVRIAPWLAMALLIVPVAGGLAGIIGPAFGWLPALDGHALGLAPWRTLFRQPGLLDMVGLSLFTALTSSLGALLQVVLLLGALLESRIFRLIQRLLSPLLAVPHAAAAIGIGFLLTPSGLASRLLSPWLTGWDHPPDYLFPGDPYGASLILGLMAKELPFLLLMSLAALPQCQAREHLHVARTLGYSSLTAFLKGVLPNLYPLIRLPVYAVIVFASATVDVAMILGPSNPTTLAVSVVRWLNDPDLSRRFMASAAALTQLGVTLTALLIWWLGERLVIKLSSGWLTNGQRRHADTCLACLASGLIWFMLTLLGASLLGLILWSLAGYWPFPQAWPWPLTADNWRSATDNALSLLGQTSLIAVTATLLSLTVVVGCLESEIQYRRRMRPRSQLILYLPLLVPPVAFLFGLVQLQAQWRLAPGWFAVTLGHMLFVLPYVFLSLSESYRHLDPRWAQVAVSLQASPLEVFWRIRLPLLTVPLLVATAVGFAVSVGQFLPTLLLGAGRVTTLTTEAVSLAGGGDRRLTAVYALLQLTLPAIGFGLAIGLPRLLLRNRRDLQPS
ncbi:ABC transporter permease [Aidingimonas halophila]|uniref:Putative thiamine transport system permease protein n=1 Tax=Aidingimonas halophila TaxID=574349 RepID=A0A1H2SAD8_9GAMM|nr:ABC transporter permease subunit [Aidingimonas halophila]GHC17957.1 ABC transporter permease [Aidingimonas halophila]SDW28545.1 putative thiamine transport system permease protein [Aidingimonas halophila]